MEFHLVADTNLFFECRSLGELPWSELGHDPIVILLTKPVLDEIDKHKKANGRTRSRALEIFGRVREMLAASVQELEIRPSSPRVVLRRLAGIVPDPTHKEYLDYSKTDERLVGIVSALAAQAPDCIVSLFTDDTGPAATADGLGVPYRMIDPSWRRPAPESTEEKKIKELEKDLAAYRAQEPAIAFGRCEPADDSNFVTVTRKIATPLTHDEVEGFLSKLCHNHPLVTDFTPPEPSTMTNAFGATTKTEYSAPPEADIANYRDTLYPRWREQCRTVLRGLHEGRDVPEEDVVLRWSMTNQGTRPATQVRVEFEAKGPLSLRRTLRKSKEALGKADDDEAPMTPMVAHSRLSSPPMPPAFHKQVTRVEMTVPETKAQSLKLTDLKAINPLSEHIKGFAAASRALGLAGRHDSLRHSLGLSAAMAAERLSRPSAVEEILRSQMDRDLLSRNSLLSSSTALGRFRAPPLPAFPQHDPEAFYYEWPSKVPVAKGALVCDLWRHQNGDEVFTFEVEFNDDGEACGTIECTVHAENLTKPETARVIVRRVFESLSMLALAEALVSACA